MSERSSTNDSAPDRRRTPGWQAGVRSSSPYLGLGFQLAGAVLLYTGVGYLVDRWLDTSPWFLVGGAVVGMIAFFVQLARVVKRMNQDTKRTAPGKKYREWEPDSWEEEHPDDNWNSRS